jgi:hypothetical protein
MLNRKIIALQSNWGGENEKLNFFFHSVGISHHISCPHTHQQNGVVERKHRHIVEMGLVLLTHASMPLKYWDELFLTATYLINRTPPNFSLMTHPSLNYLEPLLIILVFMCLVVHVGLIYDLITLINFNSNQLACVFLDYNNIHKGYKCLDISKGHIYISWNVIFDESAIRFPQFQRRSSISFGRSFTSYH